jgi:hypothetical protein
LRVANSMKRKEEEQRYGSGFLGFVRWRLGGNFF